MARIRTIKPEFYSDEKLTPMRPIDRLVFLGLISMADDAGRLIDNVKAIDGFIFSETQDSSAQSLDLLTRNGRILRYTSPSGQRLLQIAGWGKHQKIDKPGIHVLPGPSEADLTAAQAMSGHPREDVEAVPLSDLGPRTVDLVPRSPTPSALQPAHEKVEAFVELFPETHREDVRCLLVRVGDRYETWIRGIDARLNGMHPPAVPLEAMAESIRQLNANGASNWRAFEGYIRRVMAGPPPEPVLTANGRHSKPSDNFDAGLDRWAKSKETT